MLKLEHYKYIYILIYLEIFSQSIKNKNNNQENKLSTARSSFGTFNDPLPRQTQISDKVFVSQFLIIGFSLVTVVSYKVQDFYKIKDQDLDPPYQF